MSKSILFVTGSPREDGYTNKLAFELMRAFPFEEKHLTDTYELNCVPCTGCNACEETGKCVYRDLDYSFDVMEKADVVVFISPVYNGGFPAPLKAYVDRFQVYYTTFYKNGKRQPIEKRRKGIFISVSGRDGVKASQYMADSLKCAFSILNMEFAGSAHCGYTDTCADFDNALKDSIELLKRSLFDEKE